MTVACRECGSVNKKGNKFCFECGFKLTSPAAEKVQVRPSKAKRVSLKKRWLKGEISAEEYRARLLRLRLKEMAHSTPADDENG